MSHIFTRDIFREKSFGSRIHGMQTRVNVSPVIARPNADREFHKTVGVIG